MAALEPQHMVALKKLLAARFVPLLPPLLDTSKTAADQQAKQLSRAFSAYALNKLLNVTPKDAADSVVDDFNDKGLDAIHYHASTETLYLLQTKLKESEQFKQDDAQSFSTGIRLLLKQDFSGFNKNVQNRKAEIESALDTCSHIKLVIPYTGDGVSQSATEALQVLLDDEDLSEERLSKQVSTQISRDIFCLAHWLTDPERLRQVSVCAAAIRDGQPLLLPYSVLPGSVSVRGYARGNEFLVKSINTVDNTSIWPSPWKQITLLAGGERPSRRYSLVRPPQVRPDGSVREPLYRPAGLDSIEVTKLVEGRFASSGRPWGHTAPALQLPVTSPSLATCTD